MPVEIRRSSQDEVATLKKDINPILIDDLDDQAKEVFNQMCSSKDYVATMVFSGPLAHIIANPTSTGIARKLERAGLSVFTTTLKGENSVKVVIGINLPKISSENS